MHRPGMISFWFFIGVLLRFYGVRSWGAGLYGVSHPPNVVRADLHAPIWWGVLLLVLGCVYTLKFRP
jgi:hypothetical protein